MSRRYCSHAVSRPKPDQTFVKFTPSVESSTEERSAPVSLLSQRQNRSSAPCRPERSSGSVVSL